MTAHQFTEPYEFPPLSAERKTNRRHYPPGTPVLARKLNRIAGGCWEWLGSKGAPGYGHLRVNGRYVDAHRQSYIEAYGPIPDGLWVLHKCDNRSCVRPDHLFLGTAKDNSVDMYAKGKRYRHYCKRGHAMTDDNVIVRPTYRQCIACLRIHQKTSRMRSKAKGR